MAAGTLRSPRSSRARSSSPAQDGSGQEEQQVSTAMVALLAAVVAVFVFIAASTVYLRHCTGGHAVAWSPPPAGGSGVVPGGSLDSFFASRSWWQRRRRGGRGSTSRGLDADAVEAFPTMTYAEAKALRVGKARGDESPGLECAVCLSEFEDGDRLRLLLPKCSHAFHPDCIAHWLAGHVTCPDCRCNLQPSSSSDKDATSATVGDPAISVASSISSDTAAALRGASAAAAPLPVAVVIDVATDEEEEEERRQEALELRRIRSQRRAVSGRRPAAAAAAEGELGRSSHGSLAARLDRDLERFTLRLPEHVRRVIVAAAAAERGSRRRRRAGEGARSEPLVGRQVGSRWESVLRGITFSGRLSFFSASRATTTVGSGSGGAGGGEVSSSSSYSYYTRLRGKRVAAVDVVADDDVPAEAEGSIVSNGVVGGSCGADGAKAASEVAAAAAADEEKGVEMQRPT
ncbi:unnamed protein product [Urochloa humidicola]